MVDRVPSFLRELAQSSAVGREFARSFQLPRLPSPPPSMSARERNNSASTSNQDSSSKRTDGSQNSRRNRYIPRACQDCQRRKVKCSGEDVCSHCRVRNVPCVYLPKADGDARKKRTRVSSPQNRNNERDESGTNMPTAPIPNRRRESDVMSAPESRMSQLQEQVRLFGETGRPSMRTGRQPRTSCSAALYMLDLGADDVDGTDTFDNGTGCNNLSLSAQLADLQKLRNRDSAQIPNTADWNRVYPLELPTPARLHHLLGVYFREMDSFTPFLDQADTETRIFSALETLGYSTHNFIVDVDTNHFPIIALLCSILVLGECHDGSINGSDDTKPGWTMYHRGRRLIQHCGSCRTVNLDLVRYHTLSALYMMNCEALRMSSHAISTAVQLAMVAKLNNQSLWTMCTPDEKRANQRLWWTIYFLDRRIAQRNGTPYIIRDSEVAVDEFVEFQGAEKQHDTASLMAGATGTDAYREERTDNYHQSLIDFGRLWGQIWDTFYAASASDRGKWREIALTDTRILIFRHQLPAELTWETEKVSEYMANGETEPTVRRRLAIFIRANLLRMTLRQNPLLSRDANEESRHFCAQVARDSIDAIYAFADTCPRTQASGYFLSTALVECIYHLVYILQDRSSRIDRPLVLDGFWKAYQLLSDFATSWVTAKRALTALSSALMAGEDGNTFFEDLTKPHGDIGNPVRVLQEQAREDHHHPIIQPIGSVERTSPNTHQNPFGDLLMTNPSMDLGLDTMSQMVPPTLNEFSNQDLQQELHRRSVGVGAQSSCSDDARFAEFPPLRYNDTELDYAHLFANFEAGNE